MSTQLNQTTRKLPWVITLQREFEALSPPLLDALVNTEGYCYHYLVQLKHDYKRLQATPYMMLTHISNKIPQQLSVRFSDFIKWYLLYGTLAWDQYDSIVEEYNPQNLPVNPILNKISLFTNEDKVDYLTLNFDNLRI